MFGFDWLEIFAAAYVAWVVVACAGLLMNRRSPTSTLSWMFAFIALPVVSGIYYLFFGPRRLERRRARYGIARGLLASDVSAYLRGSSCPVLPVLPPQAAALAGVARRLGQGAPTFASAVKFVDEGDAYFEALAEAIGQARHHVHMEFYIWEPDTIGCGVRDALAAAAARGVKVRVLCDAVGSPRLGAGFWHEVTQKGGEALTFNPMRFTPASINFANFRTHRKITVIDGAVGFLGGTNLHDPASPTRSGNAAWHDANARIEGEPVRRLQRLFLENWMYSGGSFTLTPENLPRYFPKATEGRGLPVQIVASGPDDETAPLHAFFLAAISTARERVWIETPYLIPDEPLEAALRVAVLRGVEVQVIVPKEGDSRLVTAASHTYCEAIGKAGVEVFEYGPPMLHAKTLIADDTVGVVGTANIDNRSFRLNFEVAAAFYDTQLISRMASRFVADRNASRPFPARRRGPRITAFLESVARLTSPVL